MTFHTYQRMLRINKAYNQIKGGNSVTDTAFGLGYDSLSGFNESWKSIFGKAIVILFLKKKHLNLKMIMIILRPENLLLGLNL